MHPELEAGSSPPLPATASTVLIRLSRTARCQVNTFCPQERDERVQVGHNHMRLGLHLSSISKPGNRRKASSEAWP
jgi:hypothetical protein